MNLDKMAQAMKELRSKNASTRVLARTSLAVSLVALGLAARHTRAVQCGLQHLGLWAVQPGADGLVDEVLGRVLVDLDG